MSAVYALVDPRTDEIRYIGKTRDKVEHRVRRHYKRAREAPKTHAHFWLRSLPSGPRILILEECENPEHAEKAWIAWGRRVGLRLTNATDGGDGSPGYKHSPEAIQKMRQREVSVESRRKMSEAQKQRMSDPEQLAKFSRLGWKHSAESREQMGLSHRGNSTACKPGCTCGRHIRTAEIRAKISEGHRRRRYP